MADREHPKEHDDTGARRQPLSPQYQGIDPLTEGGKLYAREGHGPAPEGVTSTPSKKQ